MRDDDLLDDLPEAMPLHRIAPFWRLIAILAASAAVGLLFLVLILGIALVNAQNRPTAVVPPPPPVVRAAPMAPGVAFGVGSGLGVQDEATETENLPYPVIAELADAEPYEPGGKNQPSAAKPSTARQRFLDIGTDIWKLKGHLPDQLAVSPDSERLAYIVD